MWPFKKKKQNWQILAESSSQDLFDMLVQREDKIDSTSFRISKFVNRFSFTDIETENKPSVEGNQIRESMVRILRMPGLQKAMTGLGAAVTNSDGPFSEKSIIIGGSEWRPVLLEQGRLAHAADRKANGLDPEAKYARL